MAEWINETLYSGWGQRFEVLEVLARERSAFQDIVVFRSSSHGRVLMLDGCVQITEADEFFYQEMLVHVPLIAHGAARRVLIIGAGDGGVLRRVLQHQTVESAVMVEIDEAVIRLSKQHLAAIGADAWGDPRAEVLIEDGIRYLAAAPPRSIDVIIVDSTDPVGVGEVLFTESFYADCAKALGVGGIVVNQAGVPFMQGSELQDTTRLRRTVFDHVHAYTVAVPTYVGGMMALGMASNTDGYDELPAETLRRRAQQAGVLDSTRYWTPEVHVASFQLPQYISDLLA